MFSSFATVIISIRSISRFTRSRYYCYKSVSVYFKIKFAMHLAPNCTLIRILMERSGQKWILVTDQVCLFIRLVEMKVRFELHGYPDWGEIE